MNNSNSGSSEERKEEKKIVPRESQLLQGISWPSTQPSGPLIGENYVDMPKLAEITDMADSDVTLFLCNLPNSPFVGENPSTLES